MNRACSIVLGFGLLICITVSAKPLTAVSDFEDRYHSILNELRCLVCQNQTIAESNADLAKDLRAEVKKMLLEGSTDSEIIDFMASRYGDFVLYRPPLKPRTLLLWFGPFIFLGIGLLVLALVLRSQRSVGSMPLTEEEKMQVNAILDKSED